ncbi:MAG: radical SAM protein, partial [Planctomycetota bacterium]
MKILLIEPPPTHKFGNLRTIGSHSLYKADIAWPPLDLMFLAGTLDKKGHQTSICDATTLRLNYEQLKTVIVREKPQVVIFSTSTSTINDDLKTATVAKEVYGDIITIAIGTHIFARGEEVMQAEPFLDIAVYEEPEWPIMQLADNNFKPGPVTGIYYRNNSQITKSRTVLTQRVGTGAWIKNQASGQVADLNTLGWPSHDKIPLHLYRDPMMRRSPMSMTMGSRGCINSCIFCSSPFFKYRLRDVDNLIAELHWAVSLGIKEMRFFDMGFTNNLDWADRLTRKMIDQKIDLTWQCTARADRVDENILRQMKKAGCQTVHFGLESSDLSILKTIKKNIHPNKVAQAVRLCKKIGIRTTIFFMIGLPGETKETVQKTIEFAKRTNPDYMTMSIAMPHPGTVLYDYLQEHNYLRKEAAWSEYDSLKRPVYDYPELSSEEIYRLRNKGINSFYFRPSYIWRRFTNQKNWTEMKTNWRNFVGVVKRYVLSSKVSV